MARWLTAQQVRKRLAESVEIVGGQKRWAKDVGVSAAYVCDVLQGRREPGDSICRGLGFERVVRYRPVTDPTEGDADGK